MCLGTDGRILLGAVRAAPETRDPGRGPGLEGEVRSSGVGALTCGPCGPAGEVRLAVVQTSLAQRVKETWAPRGLSTRHTESVH